MTRASRVVDGDMLMRDHRVSLGHWKEDHEKLDSRISSTGPGSNHCTLTGFERNLLGSGSEKASP